MVYLAHEFSMRLPFSQVHNHPMSFHKLFRLFLIDNKRPTLSSLSSLSLSLFDNFFIWKKRGILFLIIDLIMDVYECHRRIHLDVFKFLKQIVLH